MCGSRVFSNPATYAKYVVNQHLLNLQKSWGKMFSTRGEEGEERRKINFHNYFLQITYCLKYHYWEVPKTTFLNQVRGRRAWFLKTDAVRIVCMRVRRACVCPPPRLLIISGVIRTPYEWLNKFYSCYMAIVAVIVNGRGLVIDTRRRQQPIKS